MFERIGLRRVAGTTGLLFAMAQGTVSVELDGRSFAYYETAEKKWQIAPGKFGILVGDSSESLDLKGSVELSKEAAGAAF